MPDDNYLEWARHIKDCLESTYIAVLATSEENDGVWATPIYFTYDDRFNFYFMSDSKTRHIKDIENHSGVSLAIFMPSNDSLGFKVGIQIEGRAEAVPDEEIEDVYMNRSTRLTGAKNWNKDSKGGHFIKESGGTFIKIVPLSINYIDKRYFSGDSKKLSIKKLIESTHQINP